MSIEKELLDKTLEVLGENGEHWRQGHFNDGCGHYCLIGGINEATERLEAEQFGPSYYQASGTVKNLLRAIVKERFGARGVIMFNDRPDRRFDEIKQLIAEAKKELDTEKIGGSI